MSDDSHMLLQAGFTSGIIPRSLFTAIPQLDSEVGSLAPVHWHSVLNS